MCDNWGKALWIGVLGSVRLKNALNLTTLQQCGTPMAQSVVSIVVLLNVRHCYTQTRIFFYFIISKYYLKYRFKIKGNEGTGVFISGRLYGVLKTGANE